MMILTISTTESLPETFDNLSPPPPGSVMELLDTPFSHSCLHNFASQSKNAKCAHMLSDTSDTAPVLNSSVDLANDNDTYANYNPIHPHTILFLTRVATSVKLVGLDSTSSPYVPTSSATTLFGAFIDTGRNFNMTNRLNNLVNVVWIEPFSIGMVAKEDKFFLQCTHHGEFPIPMLDGSMFYTPMFYNAQASDSILSPKAICSASGGLLSRLAQSGSSDDITGTVSFYNNSGAEVILLTLTKSNELYYSPISSLAVYPGLSSSTSTLEPDLMIYYHTLNGVDDDDISIDFDKVLTPLPSPPTVNHQTKSILPGPTPTGPTMPPMNIPTPKSLPYTPTDKFKQVEADLWQAQLGHCRD